MNEFTGLSNGQILITFLYCFWLAIGKTLFYCILIKGSIGEEIQRIHKHKEENRIHSYSPNIWNIFWTIFCFSASIYNFMHFDEKVKLFIDFLKS